MLYDIRLELHYDYEGFVHGDRHLVRVAPQSIPGGLLVTVPLPLPAFATVSVCGPENVAATALSAFIVTTHVVPAPVQAPPQPVNELSGPGVAVNVTAVPSSKLAEHAGAQEIPAGSLVTVPVPFPGRTT